MIFEDPLRRRWHRAVLVFAALALTALVTVGLVMAGFIVPPPVPQPFTRRSTVSPAEVHEAIERYSRPVYTKTQLARLARIRALERKRREKLVRSSKTGAMPLPEGVVVAFSLPSDDDPLSLASLEKHISQVDVVIPAWFELPGAGCELIEKVDDLTRRVLSRSDVIVLPRLANLSGSIWRGKQTAELMRNDKDRQCVVKKLANRLAAMKAGGVNLDIEELTPEDSEPLLEFLVDLRAELHARSMRLTVDVPFHDPAYDIEYIGEVSDAVLVMAYDEHYPASHPGPVASREWLTDSLVEIMARIPKDRLVVVLGEYGFDWDLNEPDRPADTPSFRKVMDLARAADAQPMFDEEAENIHFGYHDQDGDTHDVWFQDALTLWNQEEMLKKLKISRMGLWRLGSEDETTWTFFGATNPPKHPDGLTTVPPGLSVESYGSGEIFTLRAHPRAGSREVESRPDGHITHGYYSQVPSGFLIERRGGNPRQVVLTFDDGPSEEWTPQVLQVLREFKVPALFFVVGEEAMRFPEYVEAEIEENHLVGNHTFSHPHLEALTPREASVQLSATQRLIEGLTDKRTPLFRAPYISAVDLDSPEAFAPIRAAMDQGYVVVAANVDSKDWQRPGPEAIVQRVVDQLGQGVGQVVLFHDSGGDRSQTIEAVRLLIPRLRKLGYEFVSLDKYLGVPRSELERDLPLAERFISWGNATLARIRAWGWTFLATLFFVCTMLAIVRILFLGSLTLYELWSRRRPDPPKEFAPLVTVLIPAFNEEKVIATTVQCLLASDYRNLEIIVVDDGSKDRTGEIVREISAREPRVRLVQQSNGGKAAAANHGLQEAKGEIVVAVDADTVASPESISRLVPHFASPEVTAVCGNVEVGNVNGLLTAFQAIEYVTSQNFDRRAFSALNCISVVPGALGAWRRTAVLAAGGYSQDTLTEDADLTLTILRNGGRVVYEPEATGRTEAPETLSALLKQRFRWTYGTYQCLWKHRRAFLRGTLGWIGLPNMVLFQILFPTLSPLGDVVMLLSIFRGDWQAFLVGYLAFLVMDTCASLLAFSLDKKPLRWLALLLVQRFTYRQIMYYVSLKAMLAALRGARHGWRKLDRTGSVRAGPAVTP